MSRPIILLGAGGHALVLLDILQRLNLVVKAVVAPKQVDEATVFSKYNRLEQDEEVFQFDPRDVILVNGIGSLPGGTVRENVYEVFKKNSYQFMTVIAPSADVSPMAKLSEGVQVMAGAVIQAGSHVAENTIINTGATVDHDCLIQAHCHIAPGATLSGGVGLGCGSHVGTGAQVIQNVEVAENCVIGAGACLTQGLNANSVVYPAKVFIKENNK